MKTTKWDLSSEGRRWTWPKWWWRHGVGWMISDSPSCNRLQVTLYNLSAETKIHSLELCSKSKAQLSQQPTFFPIIILVGPISKAWMVGLCCLRSLNHCVFFGVVWSSIHAFVFIAVGEIIRSISSPHIGWFEMGYCCPIFRQSRFFPTFPAVPAVHASQQPFRCGAAITSSTRLYGRGAASEGDGRMWRSYKWL